MIARETPRSEEDRKSPLYHQKWYCNPGCQTGFQPCPDHHGCSPFTPGRSMFENKEISAYGPVDCCKSETDICKTQTHAC